MRLFICFLIMLFSTVSLGQHVDEWGYVYYELNDFKYVWGNSIFDKDRKLAVEVPVVVEETKIEPVRQTLGLTGVMIGDDFPAVAFLKTPNEDLMLFEGEAFENLFLMKISIDHVVFSCNGEKVLLDFNNLIRSTGEKNEKWVEEPGSLAPLFYRTPLVAAKSTNRQNNTRAQSGNQIMQYLNDLSQQNISQAEMNQGIQGLLNSIPTNARPTRGRGGMGGQRGGQRGGR